MLIIRERPIMASVYDILTRLQMEIHEAGINLLQDVEISKNDVMVTCIHHGGGTEKHPSCGVNITDVTRNKKRHSAGTVHCFACGYTGDLATFVSECFGHNDRGIHGYKWISERFASVDVEHRQPLKLNMSRDATLDTHIEYIGEEELDRYRYTHPYMYERKLTDPIIDYFDVGYDEDTGTLTFPVHDAKGNVLFFQRRAVVGKSFLNDTAPKGGTLYGIHRIQQNLHRINELVICESIIDALTCWTHKHPATALMGSHASPTQIQMLRRLPIRKFIFALDNDTAGREGIEKLKDELGLHKVLYRLELPEGVKDVNVLEWDEFEDVFEDGQILLV